jgi:hypothetical protein
MLAYECNPITGECGGGFGGGGPTGYTWGVSGIPYFGGTSAGSEGLLSDLLGTGIQFGTNYLSQQQQQNRISDAQQQQAEQQWDQIIAQVVSLFHSLFAQPSITADQLAQAQAAYDYLAQVASRAGGRILQQWHDPDYEPAFNSQLGQLRDRVSTASGNTGNAGGTDGGGGILGGGGTIAGIPTNTLLLVLLAVGAVMVFKN